MAAKGITYEGTDGTLSFVKRFRRVSASVGIATMGATAVTAFATVTVPGVTIGDIAWTAPNTNQLDTLTFSARVTAANTVKLYANNPTGAGIDLVASTWNVIVEKDM